MLADHKSPPKAEEIAEVKLHYLLQGASIPFAGPASIHLFSFGKHFFAITGPVVLVK